MSRREIAPQAFLAALPMFKSLDAATLQRLAAATTRHPLARGEHLFHQGDPATGLYVVVHGEIQLVARSPSRGQRLTGVVGAGHSFGEPVMFLERAAVVDAVAATDALVLQLPKVAVFAEIERSPRFARRVIASLSQRIESLVRELDHQVLGSGRERLIAYLLRRARCATGPAEFTLPATKAARLGRRRAGAGACTADRDAGCAAPCGRDASLSPLRPQRDGVGSRTRC
jgi:CRP-like cAMP-binding protein